MSRVPILVEVEPTRKQPDTCLCAKAAHTLLEANLGPVGLVGTLDETKALLDELAGHNLTPAIFIVNTFGAKAILPGLDSLMGDLPVVYLRRQLFAGRSGLMDGLPPLGPGGIMATTALNQMKPRLTSMWFYGSRNADDIARRLASTLTRFIADGDFKHFERAVSALRR
jgi:hypothetical protein